jgi:hypothetical protein
MADGKFEEGNKKGAGRPKGAENKFTREVKDVIQRLLNCMTDEDLKEIYTHLKTEKPETLISFIGKIAPKDLNIKGDVKTSKLSDSIQRLIDKDNTSISKEE